MEAKIIIKNGKGEIIFDKYCDFDTGICQILFNKKRYPVEKALKELEMI